MQITPCALLIFWPRVRRSNLAARNASGGSYIQCDVSLSNNRERVDVFNCVYVGKCEGLEKRSETGKPDRADVESAFRIIIRWTGDDPERDGLVDTPARVARAFEEYFAGYGQDPALILQKTFEIV